MTRFGYFSRISFQTFQNNIYINKCNKKFLFLFPRHIFGLYDFLRCKTIKTIINHCNFIKEEKFIKRKI